jgi:peptidoglycan/xylan/chitin deacetylase (PgdA/CDA1 family)
LARGKLTISIDLELAWGVWDQLTPEALGMSETAERPICAALIELFDRHEVPATWAVVAALLDKDSAKSRPGSKACWYAPDIIDRLVRAKVAHEIGSHGGKHVYFRDIPAVEAQADLDYMRAVHRANALPYKSFVFPRNAIGHLDLVAQAGVQTFRGPDIGWFRTARRAGPMAERAANLADKMLPIAPAAAAAEKRGALVDIPGSMLLLGRNGARRFILPAVSRAKMRMGLDRAMRTGGIFHLWFHPSNFYYRRDEQLATLAWFLEHAANEAGHDRIEIRTMSSCADELTAGAAAATRTPP